MALSFLSIILWGLLLLGGGIVIGLLGSLLFRKVETWKIGKKVRDIAKGKQKNLFRLEGENIEVDKFIMRKQDGRLVTVDLWGNVVEVHKNTPESPKSP